MRVRVHFRLLLRAWLMQTKVGTAKLTLLPMEQEMGSRKSRKALQTSKATITLVFRTVIKSLETSIAKPNQRSLAQSSIKIKSTWGDTTITASSSRLCWTWYSLEKARKWKPNLSSWCQTRSLASRTSQHGIEASKDKQAISVKVIQRTLLSRGETCLRNQRCRRLERSFKTKEPLGKWRLPKWPSTTRLISRLAARKESMA